MANNRFQILWVGVLVAGAFLAGGWFFNRHVGNYETRQEVEAAYTQDGEKWGIFDQIPESELEHAAQIAQEGLDQEITISEEEVSRQDGTQLPSQIAITNLSEIKGIAPAEKKEESSEQPTLSAPVELNLTGNEKVAVSEEDAPSVSEAEEESKITMVSVPVHARLIRNIGEYKEFKQIARGEYPTVDFAKNMVVVLESDSNWPDKVFEIVSVQQKKDKLEVNYRVNVFGLDKKLNTHTVKVVSKQDVPIELVQVL